MVKGHTPAPTYNFVDAGDEHAAMIVPSVSWTTCLRFAKNHASTIVSGKNLDLLACSRACTHSASSAKTLRALHASLKLRQCTSSTLRTSANAVAPLTFNSNVRRYDLFHSLGLTIYSLLKTCSPAAVKS